MASKIEFNIVNGPSKLDLMFTLFMHGDGDNYMREVTFTLEDGRKVTSTILSVGVESRSHEDWIIEGSFTGEQPRKQDKNRGSYWKGYYETRTRTGHISTRD